MVQQLQGFPGNSSATGAAAPDPVVNQAIVVPSAFAVAISRREFRPAQLVSCAVILGGLTILRAIFAAKFDLRVDEAYYWTWSKENVISFLDHPPMIAWCIRATTFVFGDTNFGVRFTGLVAMPVMQLLLADIVRRVVRDDRFVLLAILLPEATLDYGFGMAKVTPDLALIPFALAMVWSLARLWQSNDLRWWLAAGLFGGLALMSKYTAILLLPAVLAFVLIPAWRWRHLTSVWLWAGALIAIAVTSPVLYWNWQHDWASFRFQLDRPPQVAGWSMRFLGDFVGQQFILIGVLLMPIVATATLMMLFRGYRKLAPIPILLSTALVFPFGFFLEHGVEARVGDSWLLFAWPFGFLCATINLAQWQSRGWPLARIAPAIMIFAVASGVAAVVSVELYYLYGTNNYLGKDDPIGKEADFADVVAQAEKTRIEVGAGWFATTDYRMYSMIRWHLRERVPVAQINERARFIGFAQPALNGPSGLYVGSTHDRHRVLLDDVGATRKTVGEVDMIWRGVRYDTYALEQLTGWKPNLSPPAGDRLFIASPN